MYQINFLSVLKCPLIVLLLFEVIQHKLAELKTEICAARTFLDNLNLRYQETGQADPVSASLAKYK